MKHIDLIWNNIKQGKNIELIITILLAVLITVLQFFFPSLDRYIPALTLAILALLTEAILINRQFMEELQTANNLHKSGIHNAYEVLPEPLLESYYRDAKKEICILWTWVTRADPLPEGIVEAAKRGVKIRILHLNPTSPIAKKRLIDMGFTPDCGRPEVGLGGVKKAIEDEENKLYNYYVELRIYDAVPPFTLYRIDEVLLIGFYWHGQGSSKAPHIEVHEISSFMGSKALDTFEKIWKHGVTDRYDPIKQEWHLDDPQVIKSTLDLSLNKV